MVEGVVRPLGGDEAVARDYEECFVLMEGGRGVHSGTGGRVGGVGAADREFGVEVSAFGTEPLDLALAMVDRGCGCGWFGWGGGGWGVVDVVVGAAPVGVRTE